MYVCIYRHDICVQPAPDFWVRNVPLQSQLPAEVLSLLVSCGNNEEQMS
jgi:hypothetical protein